MPSSSATSSTLTNQLLNAIPDRIRRRSSAASNSSFDLNDDMNLLRLSVDSEQYDNEYKSRRSSVTQEAAQRGAERLEERSMNEGRRRMSSVIAEVKESSASTKPGSIYSRLTILSDDSDNEEYNSGRAESKNTSDDTDSEDGRESPRRASGVKRKPAPKKPFFPSWQKSSRERGKSAADEVAKVVNDKNRTDKQKEKGTGFKGGIKKKLAPLQSMLEGAAKSASATIQRTVKGEDRYKAK